MTHLAASDLRAELPCSLAASKACKAARELIDSVPFPRRFNSLLELESQNQEFRKVTSYVVIDETFKHFCNLMKKFNNDENKTEPLTCWPDLSFRALIPFVSTLGAFLFLDFTTLKFQLGLLVLPGGSGF